MANRDDSSESKTRNAPRQKNPVFNKPSFKKIQNTGRQQSTTNTGNVPTYKQIQNKAATFGKEVAQSLNNAPSDHLMGMRDRLQTKLAQQEELRTYYGQPQQNINTESLLNKAETGMEKSFASEYRGVQHGTHESFGTKNEYHFSRSLAQNLGREQSPNQRLSANDRTELKKEIVKTSLQLRSNIRADTENVGFNDGTQQMQHSTVQTGGVFGPSGKKHNTNDRDTQSAIVKSTQQNFLSKSTLDQFEEFPNHIAAVTSKRFMAPSDAQNQTTTTSDSSTINHQMKQREYVKMNAHLGQDLKNVPTQDRTNRFDRSMTLGTNVSPRRTGVSDKSVNKN